MPPAEPTRRGSFDGLSPASIVKAVEASLGQGADGTLTAYPSYVNRVYGLRLDDDSEIIAKFYRPGRWSRECILDEHRFLRDCEEAELPTVAPLALPGGESLGEILLDGDTSGDSCFFALFPRMGGRNFDAETDEDWLRLGAVLGRLHAVGAIRGAPARPRCDPVRLTRPLLHGLLAEKLVHPEVAGEFEELCERVIEHLAPRFESVAATRIHGDCHRGNILDRTGSGLLVIDFDDMMSGPAVQDFWLLLPDHADRCRRELELLIEGYEAFLPFDRRELALIEGLRFMRMVYFLAWRSRQRHDKWFKESFPDWGNKAFWVSELEDLREQAELVGEGARPPAGGQDEDEDDEDEFASWEKE